MPWKIDYNSELGLILHEVTGRLTWDDFKVTAEIIIPLAKEKNTHLILVDATKLEGVSSKIDIYNLPQHYNDLKSDRKNRLAVILPKTKEAIDAVGFYRTVCRNRGWNVEVFPQKQEAIDWLLSSDA